MSVLRADRLEGKAKSRAKQKFIEMLKRTKSRDGTTKSFAKNDKVV